MAITAKTFPGVYTQIRDESFLPPATSRFRLGIIGVASKGPFNVATAVRSLKEFRRLFGRPLTTTYNDAGNPVGNGFFLADTCAILADLTDAVNVVRVGNQYTDVENGAASGLTGSYTFGSAKAAQLDPALSPTGDVYVRLVEAAKATTANARVIGVAGTNVTLSTTTPALQATYASATVGYSFYEGAANSAESVLYAYTYGTNSSSAVDAALTTFGTIVGTKNAFQFTVQNNPASIEVGAVYKVKETNKDTTHEVRVKSVVDNTVLLETSDLTRAGYQALPLADNYEAAQLYKVTGRVAFLYLEAASAGEWANGSSTSRGLYVSVKPGSLAGTKKLEIFEDGALVETIDNLSDDPDSTDYYTTRINGLSQYITINQVNDIVELHAANTAAPWDAALATTNLAVTPKSMPFGTTNGGGTSGGSFVTGYNGSSAQDSDFVGDIEPSDDSLTGLKAFEDTDNLQVDVIAAPMNDISVSVMQEMRRVAKKVNAVAICDVPAGISARNAVDWHNGTGSYAGRGRIDDPNIAVYWNWLSISDPFEPSSTKLVPPTLGALRCMAFTFDRDKPWYAAAGETRGNIPEALGVQYPKVTEDVKAAMYGNGQSVNPILLTRGRILVYGERTLQIAESKLSVVHNVVLINITVSGLADIGRRFVFDPNDAELLVQIRLAFSEFLDKIKNERGIEEYNLRVDESNNTADTRNRREVIVDLSVIPTDSAERIYINAVVRESGAQLNSTT